MNLGENWIETEICRERENSVEIDQSDDSIYRKFSFSLDFGLFHFFSPEFIRSEIHKLCGQILWLMN